MLLNSHSSHFRDVHSSSLPHTLKLCNEERSRDSDVKVASTLAATISPIWERRFMLHRFFRLSDRGSLWQVRSVMYCLFHSFTERWVLIGHGRLILLVYSTCHPIRLPDKCP